MNHVLFVGLDPNTVDFSDPALPPGLSADKIQLGITVAIAQLEKRGWQAHTCMISPDELGCAILEKQLALINYSCVVIGAGLRLPATNLILFEKVINIVRSVLPRAAIAFNTRPEDTADAAARWLKS